MLLTSGLNEFYDSVVDLADRFAESAQLNGILNGYTLGELNSGDIIPFLEKQYNDFLGMKKEFTEGHLLQIIDDITELYSSTLYKLKNLK